MSTESQEIGKAGERLAAQFLRSRGCPVLARNVYCDGGEIDLVVDDHGTVAAVEVKTSTRRDATDRVDDRKWSLVHRTGAAARFAIGRYDILTVHLSDSDAAIRWMRGTD